MTACAPTSPPQPPLPLSPELRSDLAARRAGGESWDAIGAALRFDPAALRRAAAADPLFAAEYDAAWAGAMQEAEATALRALRKLTASDNEKVALRAAEAVVVCVGRYRQAEVRRERAAGRAVETKTRPDAPRAVPRASAEPVRPASAPAAPRAVPMG
jgi:hypothetical protein